jgi:hypothetical protein
MIKIQKYIEMIQQEQYRFIRNVSINQALHYLVKATIKGRMNETI